MGTFIAHLPLCNLHIVQTSLMRNFDFIKHCRQQKNIIQLVVGFSLFSAACLIAALMLGLALLSWHTFVNLNQLFSRVAVRNDSLSFPNLIKQIATLALVKIVLRTAKSVTFLTALSIFSNQSNFQSPKNHQKQGEHLEISPAKCKQLLSAALLVVGIFFGGAANAAYVQSIIPQTAFAVPTAPSTYPAPPDDGNLNVALPFTFNYAGAGRNTVFIGTNGFLTFSAGSNAFANAALFAAGIPADAIMPYWDDLFAPSGGTITYGTAGTAPNRQFVVTWTGVPHFDDRTASCTFQVVLGEDQTIRFRYSSASVRCNGGPQPASGNIGATTGIQENSTTFIQRSLNTAITTQDVLYSPFPSLSVQKTAVPICDPFNGTSNPKNIPGSISRYTVTITNTGSATASLSTVGDALISFLTFDPNLVLGATAATCLSAAPGVPENAAGRGFKINVTGSTRTGYPKYLTNAADADGATFASPNITIDYTTALPAVAGVGGYAAGELKGGESVIVIFNVTVN